MASFANSERLFQIAREMMPGGVNSPVRAFGAVGGIPRFIERGEGAYLYAITGAGIARAREALERSQYAGPAPVPIQVYNESVLRQAQSRPTITNRTMRQALSHLVLSEATFQRIGPAVTPG